MVPRRDTAALRTLLGVVALALALVLTLLLARSYPIDSDEGYTLNAGWQLWHGLRMYDDFRLFVGPGCGYALLWLWKLVGSPSHLAARLFAVGFFYMSALGLYVTLRQLGVRGGARALAVAAWLFLASFYVPLNHNSFSSYAAIWFVPPYLRLVSGTAPHAPQTAFVDAVLAGLALGVVFLFLPTKGALLAAAAGGHLLVLGLRRRALRPVLTFAAAFALVLAPLVVRWRATTLVTQWLLIPINGDYLGHTGASVGYLVAAALLLVVLGGIALRLRDARLKALALVQGALLASIGHNLELGHLAINAFPVPVFVAVLVGRLLPRPARRPEAAGVIAMAFVTATVAAWAAMAPAGAAFLSDSSLSVDLLGRRPPSLVSPRLAAAHAIYAGPFLPGLYYLLGKPNPFFVSETVVCNDACQRRLIGELEAVRPEVAFLNYAMIAHLDYDQNAPVDAFLRAHYARCPDRGYFQVRAIDPTWCP